MVSFSETLFQLNSEKKVKFAILKSSRDSSLVSKFIELGGGSVKISANYTPNAINLCCFNQPWMIDFEIFNTSYVFACCVVNKRLSVKNYSIGKRLSEKDIRNLDRDYLFLDSQLNSIGWKNTKGLELEDVNSLDISSIHSFDGQEPSKHSLEKNRKLEESSCVNNALSKGCEEDSSSCISVKRRTRMTLAKNVDDTACSEIYPEDSVSQIEESVSSGSSSIELSRITFRSSDSDLSEWARSVRMWVSDED